MAEPRMPTDLTDWMNARQWGSHHLEWHTTRQWDLLGASDRAWAVSQGWSRAARQEGTAGNGFDFLMMHRAMLQLLRETFPAHASLLAGWSQPPTDPNSVRDPMPVNTSPRIFSNNMRSAVTKLHSSVDLAAFANDDALGLYIETTLRPTATDPRHLSSDVTVGIHNYLHNRFSDRTSDINLGRPLVNLANQRFWRLHGWLDARWTAFRAAKGLSDTDPAFVAALNAEKNHLRNMGMGGHAHPMGIAHNLPGNTRFAVAQSSGVPSDLVPVSVAEPFQDHLSRRFEAAMTAGSPADLQELKKRIQLAIELELFTIPLYLTGVWSLKLDASDTTGDIRSLIMQVALQEMLHMGLMCNLLVAVGGKPVLNHPDHLPRYPNFPPGIDLPQPVKLEPFSRPTLNTFLRIEHPQHAPIKIPVLRAAAVGAPAPKFKTIGDFYDSLKAGLVHATAFNATGQLTTSFGNGDALTTITSRADAEAAIALIKEQGEGNSSSPAAGPTSAELAHYYRFLQIKDGRKFVKQPNGTFKQDPSQPLPFPTPAEIYPMAAPLADDTFDAAYSHVVQLLHDAWNQGLPTSLINAVLAMSGLEAPAIALMQKPRVPNSGGNYGPAFLWHTAPIHPPEPPAGPPPAAAAGFARIQQILDNAVHGQTIGAHGPFWRGITRDQFVAKVIFGQKLLANKPDGSFDPVESNLMKALEGRTPFDGSIFKRMPDGFPPLTDPLLTEIRNWITQGCPDTLAVANWFDDAAGGPVNGQQHIDYWRDFDNWAMFHVTPEVSADIGVVFNVVGKWNVFAKDATKEADWVAAIAPPDVRAAIGRLEAHQRDTVTTHYGRPIPLLTLLDGYERFGDNSLPNDPLRPADVRHMMNGDTMWFIWSAFADACLRIGGTIPAEFWQRMARAILTGLLNDGLFRGRFHVTGFTPDASGKVAIRTHARTLPVANISSELRSRYRDFQP